MTYEERASLTDAICPLTALARHRLTTGGRGHEDEEKAMQIELGQCSLRYKIPYMPLQMAISDSL
jgi:hypothetical protein